MYPGVCEYMDIVDKNIIQNLPVTHDDIWAAEDIFGPNLGSLKGKTVSQPSVQQWMEFWCQSRRNIRLSHSPWTSCLWIRSHFYSPSHVAYILVLPRIYLIDRWWLWLLYWNESFLYIPAVGSRYMASMLTLNLSPCKWSF
jgi:hypothetical protein